VKDFCYYDSYDIDGVTGGISHIVAKNVTVTLFLTIYGELYRNILQCPASWQYVNKVSVNL